MASVFGSQPHFSLCWGTVLEYSIQPWVDAWNILLVGCLEYIRMCFYGINPCNITSYFTGSILSCIHTYIYYTTVMHTYIYRTTPSLSSVDVVWKELSVACIHRHSKCTNWLVCTQHMLDYPQRHRGCLPKHDHGIARIDNHCFLIKHHSISSTEPSAMKFPKCSVVHFISKVQYDIIWCNIWRG